MAFVRIKDDTGIVVHFDPDFVAWVTEEADGTSLTIILKSNGRIVTSDAESMDAVRKALGI